MKTSALRIALLSMALVLAWTAADAKMYSDSALHKASDLIGLNVQNSSGEKIGTVVDLVLDQSLNKVTHAVFTQRSQGEWAHYAIPFGQLSMASGGNAILLDVDTVDLSELPDADLRVSRVWFQGPVDVEWQPVEERAYAPEREYARGDAGMIDIYGRPIPGKARTPYVQNVYKQQPGSPGSRYSGEAYDYDRTEWRGYERDQYGRPVFERDYYVGDDTYGHNGHSVQEEIYGRPIQRDLYRGDAYVYDPPSRSDWRWGDGIYGHPHQGYDRYGKNIEFEKYDRFGRPLTRDYDSDRYGRPIYRDDLDYDRYGRPIDRDSDYDRYGRPLERDTWGDRTYGRPKRDMGEWFKTDWSRDGEELGLRRVSNLLGTDVEVSGRDAGYIDDFAIDMREGHVAYMLISLTRDFAGASNRMAAIPWEAVDLMPRQNLASIDISRSALLDLAFAADDMPDLFETSYARRLHEQFNVSPYWETLGYVGRGEAVDLSGSAWSADSWYAMSFDPDKVNTFSGTIESISSFKPSADASAGLRLRVRTDDGRLLLVNAGPFNFANEKGMQFNTGERITVTGSTAQIGGQNVILASQLKKDDLTVQLRTRQGRPLW